jgi:hypothetical protein
MEDPGSDLLGSLQGRSDLLSFLAPGNQSLPKKKSVSTSRAGSVEERPFKLQAMLGFDRAGSTTEKGADYFNLNRG